MLSWGQKSYVPLQQAKPHANGGAEPSGDAWAPAEGDAEPADVERNAAETAPRFGAPVSSGMGTDNGRVQVPIGMVSEDKRMKAMQILALSVFTAINVFSLLALFGIGLAVRGWFRFVIILVGGSAWLSMMLFNMRTAAKPRRVLQTFLNNKAKTKLGRRLGRGQIVVVKGAVSLLNEELLSTEFHNVPGLVLVESSLRSYHPGVRKADAWTEHVRQTRAVDFRVTDAQTGMSAIVKAFNAAETGVATPLVHISTEVPLSTAAPVASPAAPADGLNGSSAVDSAEEARRKRVMQSANPQLMVCKGYIRQGQVITVMGQLFEEPGTHELLIEPLGEPYNVSKMLLFKNFVPFFFPVWASGLIISDQRDLI